MTTSKKCFLHIGSHKTGTTSFQKFCEYNQHILNSCSVHYPLMKVSNDGIPQPNHSLPIRNALDLDFDILSKRGNLMYGNNENDIRSFCTLQLKSILANTQSNLLVSGEDLSTMSEAAQRLLISSIHKNSFSIHSYFVVRSPYDYHKSKICQNIKLGGTFSDSIKRVRKFSTITKQLATIFPDLNLVLYEHAVRSKYGLLNYYMNRFCSISTYDLDFTNEGININSGGCDQVIRLFGSLNEKLGGKDVIMKDKVFYLKYTDLIRSCFQKIKGAKFQLRISELSENTLRLLHSENEALMSQLDEPGLTSCSYKEDILSSNSWSDKMEYQLNSIISQKMPEFREFIFDHLKSHSHS